MRRAGREALRGTGDNDLFEIVRFEVVGHRDGARVRLGVRPCSIRAVFVIQSFLDGISAHGYALQRRLRIVPRQRPL